MYRVFFLCVIIFFSFYSNAQDVVDSATGKTVFWKISGNGLKEPSYLYGTAHPIFRNDIYIADTVMQIFSGIETVYFERLRPDSSTTVHLDSVWYLMDKPRLPKLLGKVNYNMVVKTLEQFEHPVLKDPSFNKMTPEFLQIIILNSIFGDKITAFDDSLMNIAIQQKKTILPLDSEEFLEEYRKMKTLNGQATALFQLVSNLDSSVQRIIRSLKKMAKVYYSGSIEVMYLKNTYIGITNGIGGRTFYRYNEFAKTMLDNRNKAWLLKMTNAMVKESVFFAFGAAHLSGNNGVINLLRRKGYNISPVYLNFGQKE